jgi:hypothetical protein
MSGAWDAANPTIGSKHRRLSLTSSPPAGRCARSPIPSPGRTGPRFVSRCISQPRLLRGSCTVGVRTNAMCPVFRPVGFDREGKDRPCVLGSNRPLQAHPISLRCRPRPGWATSSSAKGTDGTGTAAGRREGRAVEQASSRGILASFSSLGGSPACSMRSGTQGVPPGMTGSPRSIPECPTRSHRPSR